MLHFFKKHPKLIIGICIAAAAVAALSVYQRDQYLKNPYENQLNNPARVSECLTDSFYYDQLTVKEKTAYAVLEQAAAEKHGGVVAFPEGLTGEEYTRITQAFDCGQADRFDCMADIPMTASNQNVSYLQRNILNVTEPIIMKCVLFFYSAEGLDRNGSIDKDGYVTNLEALAVSLAALDPEREALCAELTERSEAILQETARSVPEGCGTKEAIDYFLDWMDRHLVLDTAIMESTETVSSMSEVFEQVYFESHRSCVVHGKATAVGYCKVLTHLCNLAGIDAHLVMGNWKGSNAYTMVCVDFEGTPVFIDASGYKHSDLWEQRYISSTLAANYLSMPGYFDFVK